MRAEAPSCGTEPPKSKGPVARRGLFSFVPSRRVSRDAQIAATTTISTL